MNLLQAIAKRLREPFSPQTDEERQAFIAMEEDVKRDVRHFTEIYREMLADNRYTKARENYREKILPTTIRLMIWLDEPDPYKYQAKMKHYQEQLRILTQLVDVPREFAARAEEPTPKKKPSPAEQFAGADNGQ